MRLLFASLFAAGVIAHGQTPHFDVASVKVVAPTGTGHSTYGPESVTAHPGSLTMRNMRLRGLIKWAYDVREYQISGPAWMGAAGWKGNDLARFEVIAKAGSAPEPEMRKMLQRLLEERFRLKLHRENREMSVHVVTVGKASAALKPSTDPNAEGKCEGRGPTLICENTKIADFVEMLATPLGAPVVDETGLTGGYSFTLGAPEPDGGDMVFAIIRSIQDHLGLKFDRGKRAIEMLVIDSVEKSPSEN
jgi:uncharacterized protein (TIGR03435 family)